MTPPPGFTAFFDGPFSQALRAVVIPGAETASWDRRAAWLLWLNTDEGRAFVPPSSEMKADADPQPPEIDLFS